MPAPPLPEREEERLEELRSLNVLDSLPEQAYDDITYLAAMICDCPIALVSLVDGNRQWFKAKVGLDAEETPREFAFCAHAIVEPELLIVPDARQDERFASNPLVTAEPSIRFYAGAPLVTIEGNAMGALCVIDRQPRHLTPGQLQALQALSRQVTTLLDMRAAVIKLEKWASDRHRYEQVLEGYQKELEEKNERLAEQSITDSLTGIHNRRALLAKLDEECSRADRYNLSLSLVLVDVDDFKSFNDSFGHPAGDEVLQRIAALLERDRRTADFVGRLGGEEFGIVLGNTETDGAVVAAEALCKLIENEAWPNRSVTISVGVAAFDNGITDSSALISAADRALYAAKEGGKNRVALADELQRSSR